MTTMQIDRAVVEQALEAIEGLTRDRLFTAEWAGKHGATVAALRAALAQQDEPNAHGYASRLAVAIWEKHYKDIAPQWKPLDDLMGVLTQIDNMTSGLTLLAQQAEPVEDVLLSAAGLALDALEHDRQAAARSGRSISMLSSRAIEELRGAFRAALAQRAEPVQEPAYKVKVAGRWHDTEPLAPAFSLPDGEHLLYTAPPQRKPLTEEALVRFAALVAAAEREACAALLEANGMRCGEESLSRLILETNAAAIRARNP